MTRLSMCALGCMTFLLYCLHLFAEAGTDSVQRVDPESVPVVCLRDERQSSLSALWDKYKASSSAKHRRVVMALLTDRPNTEVSDSIDREICAHFAEDPTADTALLLGMCHSDRSRNLLEQYTTATDMELAEACRLGLARQGDKAAEALFIEKYVQQAEGQTRKAGGNGVDALIASICRLEYIGSADAILAVFDSVGSDAMASADDVTVNRNTAANMRAFLTQVGVSVPSGLSEDALAQWWDENRDAIGEILREKKDLPRLKKSRIIKSIH